MSKVNNHIVIFKYNSENNKLEENIFTKVKDKFQYSAIINETDSIKLNEFNNRIYDSSNLNFTFKNGNKLKPNSYLEWFFSNKNVYEINQGIIFKLSNPKLTICKKLIFLKLYTYDEIKNNLIESFENIHMGIFVNDYTNEYSNTNVKFIQIGIEDDNFNL
jgi:hypothetical protein